MDNEQLTSIEAPNATPYIVASIIELLCCGGILGIISLVLSIMASSDVKNGNIDAAKDKLKWTKILLIICVALAALGIIICVALAILFGIGPIMAALTGIFGAFAMPGYY